MSNEENGGNVYFTPAQIEAAESIVTGFIEQKKSPVDALAILVLAHSQVWRIANSGNSTVEMLEVYIRDFYTLLQAPGVDAPPPHNEVLH